jgi:predicted enzyme related to lactoylglutathione lyase
MSTETPPAVGTIVGTDLTVDKAEDVRDFYARVVGWEVEPLTVDDHEHYVMKSPSGEWVAGVCHRLGPNADLPARWLVYVAVSDLEQSIARCAELGGSAITPIKGLSEGTSNVVVRDPAGAVLALSGPTPNDPPS